MVYDLNEEQTKWLKAKFEDKYGGYGSFIGMVLNQTYEYGEYYKFSEFLKQAIDVSMNLEASFDEFELQQSMNKISEIQQRIDKIKNSSISEEEKKMLIDALRKNIDNLN